VRTDPVYSNSVVIKRSSTREVQDLVADILSESADEGGVRREAAVARLRVIGDRAVRQVLGALDDAPAVAQVALLRVLEGRRETAVVTAVTRALAASQPDVRAAAVLVARSLLDEPEGPDLLGKLASIATDEAEPRDVRLAAIAALVALPGGSARPVLAGLSSDPDPAIRLAAAPRSPTGDEPGAEIEDAASGQLPADASRLLDALARDAAHVPLPTLHKLVTVVREREAREKRAPVRTDWLAVRGAVHRALAARGSRVALYDIRETLESSAAALPASFAQALAEAGDAACLESIAVSYAAVDDEEWRESLTSASRAIAARERVTPRSAAGKRLKSKLGDDMAKRLLFG
jgi:hypothetical protein